jgi:hypothetical protein
MLFLLFLGLKLSGSVDWSWWWIVSPLFVQVVYRFLNDIYNELQERDIEAKRMMSVADKIKQIEQERNPSAKR